MILWRYEKQNLCLDEWRTSASGLFYSARSAIDAAIGKYKGEVLNNIRVRRVSHHGPTYEGKEGWDKYYSTFLPRGNV